MKLLKLFFEIKKEYKIEDYKMDVLKESKEYITTIDFKNDDNFDSINKVNEYLIENLNKYDSIDIIFDRKDEIIGKNDQWKKIIKLIEDLWKNEFNEIKEELRNLNLDKKNV